MGRVRAAARTWWVPSAVVAVALIALQLLLIPMDRALGWDETVYVSQVDRSFPVLPFVASRSRGIVVLIWPLVQLGLSLEAMRIVLAVASSVALVAAAACWGPLLMRPAAAATALVVGISWPFVVSGSEVMPNLWSAVLLLAAGGLLARGLVSGNDRPSWWALGLLSLAALVRPVDAVVFVAAAAVVVLWVRGRAVWLLWLGAAVVLGCLPWLVEMSIRYGGVDAALDVARSCGHVDGAGGIHDRVARYLAPTDGPRVGRIPLAAVAWWAVVLGLGVTAAYGHRAGARVAARLGLVTAIALAAVYVLLVSGAAPRFLLPVLALAVAAAAAELPELRRTALIALTILALFWGGWQVSIAHDVARAPRVADVAPSILAADRPCLDTGA